MQWYMQIQCKTLSVVRYGKKKRNWKFDFRFMLFALSFRLMFCNAVSKEGCDRNESVIAK